MLTKKMISCIYLYQKRAVAGIQDLSEVSRDPVALAESYAEWKCDEILVYDLSEDDASHEESIDLIREICSAVPIPVIGAGHIRRMEDVKKLLYAGCRQAVLDYDRSDNVELTKEVSLKFGPERLLARIGSEQMLEEAAAWLKERVSGVLLTDVSALKMAVRVSPVPVFVFPPDISLDKLMEILKLDNVGGIAGKLVNDNIRELEAIRGLCVENGIQAENAPAEEMVQAAFTWQELKKNSDGLVPVIVQDCRTDAVLMQAYMNEEAYETTIHTGKMTYFSRSRGQLWVKGETSGHFQYVKSLYADCDLDTILAKVVQIGPACHTGSYSCFFNEILSSPDGDGELPHNPAKVFEEVYGVIKDRKEHPKEGSYTNYLFDKGIDKILKKLGEESTEIVIAAKNPNPNEIKYEICDFLYHMMVLMVQKGITWEEIMEELAKR
ncbi:MAG TPA: bifunctional phosphoribosyl-AMP cyclohydrolase/phosphoribosyl-ATP diphosphatase HisIE [Candidatus Eisenbergiella merdipullorum]|uniref:Histidine biosynthesis bifunctional protein HisIE n=1 Tax=Candidatus Eisenbergiella merdipullorum TaxID=2838553 RepID=A0A9D2L1D5_9FIRM|nr:bifunctional phosphoribosyl-AMP cyclohydrolase/phosphoribosyl-ATP diphosphatase HisIE [Candidatus Eisenbergiella merdipullorum]